MRSAARTTAVMAGLLMSTGALVAGLPVQPAAAASVSAAATTQVNIRLGPSTSTKVLGQLARGQRITTTAAPAKGWVRVRFDGGTAYMYASYLNLTGPSVPAPKTIATNGVKIATAKLNVRSGPATSYAVVGTLAEGSDLRLTGKQSGGYAQTSLAKQLRWVSVQYLASSTKTTAVAAPAPPVASPSSSAKGAKALAFAKSQLGKPYRFGAAGPSSYDCSGLTLASWRAAGVSLPRTAAQQYQRGHRISKASLRPGDLVFFYSQTPSHVAIYAGNGQVIHAPRPGRTVEYIKMSYMPYAGAVRPG